MAVAKHPMSALKGTQAAKDMMDAVRGHKKPAAKTPPASPEPEVPAADERSAARRLIKSRPARTGY